MPSLAKRTGMQPAPDRSRGRHPRQRIVLDSSAILGAPRHILVAGAALRNYDVYWSSWLIAEFVRKRTEWIGQRAVRDGCTVAELRRQQRESRERVDDAIADMSRIFRLVDYTEAAPAELDWLADENDHPVMQTALAARASILVTDTARDFPLGQARNSVGFVTTHQFVGALCAQFPEAEEDIRQYLG